MQQTPAFDIDDRLDGLAYCVQTFGCQMNKHDSERICGMFDCLGAFEVEDPADSDIVVYMTCCVREKADERLFGQVASLKNAPAPHGKRITAIGGCIGQRDGEELLERFTNVDIVFGTQNVSHLPGLIASVMAGKGAQAEVLESSTEFATALPQTRRPHGMPGYP